MTKTITPQRAYTGSKPLSASAQEDRQRRAQTAALIAGDMDEWNRCESRIKDIETRPNTKRKQVLPSNFCVGPAGAADAVLVMFKDGLLTLQAVQAAMDLRSLEEHPEDGTGSGGGVKEYVDGRTGCGMEAMVDGRDWYKFMKARMQDELGPKLFPIVWQLILGNYSMSKGVDRLGGRKQKAFGTLHKALQDALNMAAFQLGKRNQRGM